MPQFKIGAARPIGEIPVVPKAVRSSQFSAVYEQLLDLKKGLALTLHFEDAKGAKKGREILRRLAKRRGDFLSSASGEEQGTVYFWIEPKENVQERMPAKTKKVA